MLHRRPGPGNPLNHRRRGEIRFTCAHLPRVPRFPCTRTRPRRTVRRAWTSVRPFVGPTVAAAWCSGDRGAREGGDHGDDRVRGVLTAGDGDPPFYFPPPLHGAPNTRSRTRTCPCTRTRIRTLAPGSSSSGYAVTSACFAGRFRGVV